MERLYFVSIKTISQAERMRDKYAFILEQKEDKLYSQTEQKLTEKEINDIEKAIAICREKINKISDALLSIQGYNKVPAKYYETLLEAAALRDVLDEEIETKRNFN